MTTMARFFLASFGLAALVMTSACGGDSDEIGSSCDIADDCFSDIAREDIQGEIECLDRVAGGYCTHQCETDADCCAVAGECEQGIAQVCAPFENSTIKRCFLSCEPADVGDQDENEYCAEFAHADFLCRSTGGGAQNRKVCVPGG